MADVVVLANVMSMPIKLAWILWLAWGLVQISWYRRGRIDVRVSKPAPHARFAKHRAGPPRDRSRSAPTPEPSAPGNVGATASDAAPPSNDAEATIRLERRPSPSASPSEEVASSVAGPPHES